MLPIFPLPARAARRLAMLCMAMPMARAEGQIRIAGQHGITFLAAQYCAGTETDRKHGKQQGVDVKVEWITLSGGPAINDALLSGNIDIAGAGLGPLLTIWDRTKGRQNVRGVASLGNFPTI
jgi:NitT/TauT family transport system substrate-binding protein